MALYKNADYLHDSDSAEFDETHTPGTPGPHSGIYRCENCGREDACNAADPLPPQNHNQHNPANGPIRWRLIVYAQQKR